MCQLTPKLIYIYENKVFCTFFPNFILKINTTGILWYRGILWYIYLYMIDVFAQDRSVKGFIPAVGPMCA